VKDVRAKDLQLAEQLVNSLAADWDPTKYSNEYRRGSPQYRRMDRTAA
jgi:non-homologous end joining protein Ku